MGSLTIKGLPQQAKSEPCRMFVRRSRVRETYHSLQLNQVHDIFRTLPQRQKQSTAHAAHASAIKQNRTRLEKNQILCKQQSKLVLHPRPPARPLDIQIQPNAANLTLSTPTSRRPPLHSRYHRTFAGQNNNHKHRIRHPFSKTCTFTGKIQRQTRKNGVDGLSVASGSYHTALPSVVCAAYVISSCPGRRFCRSRHR